MLKLVKPDIKYKDSFIAMCEECRICKIPDISGFTSYYGKLKPEFLDDFENNIVKPLLDINHGQMAKNWGVPTSQLWCVDEKENIVGLVDIRHILSEENKENGAGNIGAFIKPSARGQGWGTKMLELAINYTHEMKLEETMVCCHAENAASQKMIERNLNKYGGKRLSDIEQSKKALFRYMIKTSQGR